MAQDLNLPFLALSGLAVLGGLIFVAMLLNIVGAALRPQFKLRPLMNKAESAVYRQLVKAAPAGWVVMCQVSYGAFLSNKSRKRYWTVNAKRADFIITDGGSDVVAVIEYQGSGHYGSSRQGRERAEKSDRIKRTATTEAGIHFFELPKNSGPDQVARLFDALTPAPSTETDRA